MLYKWSRFVNGACGILPADLSKALGCLDYKPIISKLVWILVELL